ncbi:MAG: N-acetylmuramoyl-L-alanine amidase, partial [Mobilicoccus sp.]|nr:N-acetylmuramoyl-L-alanine amidase [Mobilicoccus sp.]
VPRDVAVVGVTWDDGTGTGARPQIRVQRDGAWEPWADVDVETCAGCGTGEVRAGTEPVVLTGATRVEARILSTGGSAARAPRLSVIDGTAVVEGDGTAAAAPARTAATTTAGSVGFNAGAAAAVRPVPAGLPGPRISMPAKRAAWRATENRVTARVPRLAPRGVVVHHTAGTNDYTRAQVPAILRGIQRFHSQSRGWSDIGYNALVDRFGGVWEGRRGGIGIPHRGAHAQGVNDLYLGVAYIGDTTRSPATPVAFDTMTDLIAWTSARYGFDLTGTFWSRGVNRPVMIGHGQVNRTSCPGTDLRNRLPQMRTAAQEQAQQYLRISRENAGRG